MDLWVADNPLFGHYDWYFWCGAACCMAVAVVAMVAAGGSGAYGARQRRSCVTAAGLGI